MGPDPSFGTKVIFNCVQHTVPRLKVFTVMLSHCDIINFDVLPNFTIWEAMRGKHKIIFGAKNLAILDAVCSKCTCGF